MIIQRVASAAAVHIATHAATGSITGRVHGLVLTLSSYWRTGMPYTVTLAEATPDGFFTARPPGIT